MTDPSRECETPFLDPTWSVIRKFDRDQVREHVRNAKPFPFFCIDGFLEPEVAAQIVETLPSFEQASTVGKSFSTVNEHGKIQVTDPAQFAEPVMRLYEALASLKWLNWLSYVMDIPNLVADSTLNGGGIHVTGPRGHLDVHVDFNYIKEMELHRRINILVYFNKNWREEWGENVELWDKDVKSCHHSLSPIFNRCVVFATSDSSYHGVTAVTCPNGNARKSFAAYYYTKEPPPDWTGEYHSTIFKARPDERMKGMLLMPAEKIKRAVRSKMRKLRSRLK